MYILSSVIIVVRGFLDQDSYTVREEVGVVEVCVVLDGFIEREVVISLFTVDGTAIGNRKSISHTKHTLRLQTVRNDNAINGEYASSKLFFELIPLSHLCLLQTCNCVQ